MGFLFIGVPLVLASLMPLIGKLSKRVLPDLLANGALLFLSVFSVVFGRRMLAGGPVLQQLGWLNEPVHILLALDGFSLFMLFTISLISLCVSLYSINYMEHYGSKAVYYALFLIMITGMNGLVLSNDLFTMYLFLEVAAVASYGLVAFGLGQDELEASYKYLMLSAVASALVLFSITLLFGLTGSLDLGGMASGLKTPGNPGIAVLCAALFFMGFGLKAAIVPFHAWLPDAHPSAPAPISAMLSGLLIKVSGLYALTRVLFQVFGMNPALSTVLLYLGAVSILVGALLALRQNDIKRMLAYSSISQIGYILLGIGLGTPMGILGALFHLFNHASGKALLFLNSGSVEQATGTRSLDKMGGLAKRMPFTAATSVVGSLTIAGVPPLAGFWSKLIIIIALFEANHTGFAVIAVLASVLTLWYYLLMQRRAFFGKLNEAWNGVKEAPFWMTVSTVALALICIAAGLVPSFMMKTWLKPAADALSAGLSHVFMFKPF